MANMQPIREAFADTIDILGIKHFVHKWGHSRQYIERLWGDEEKNLPVHYLMDAMEETGDHRILLALALPLDRRVARVSGQPDGEDMRHEILQAILEFSEFIKAAEEGEHYTRLFAKIERLTKEIEDIAVRARLRDEGGNQ